jgi:hypothetical protein
MALEIKLLNLIDSESSLPRARPRDRRPDMQLGTST